MPDNKTEIKKTILTKALQERRKMQHQALLNWDKGLITARKCIEDIIDLEKIIKIDRINRKGSKDGR